MNPKPAMFVLLISCIGLLAASVIGDEGMWPLYDLDKLPWEDLERLGLELGPDDIFNPGGGGLSDAVINLGGGSASFVSETGLIVTNHHVAYGAIQKQSTVDANYLRDGFYAPTPTDEIPAIGYNVYVTLAVEDVTDRIATALDDSMDDLDRYLAIDGAIKEIVAEAETGRDVRCEVAKMFGGSRFMLYTYFQIRDIRIVYAPPESIGKFGGDIDNWMWPRHTGDFSFLRAYVAPDGSSADYSPDNVPYRPKRFLPISSQGIEDGSFAMMIGFPGRTQRYRDSYSIDYLVNVYYPHSIEILEDELVIIDEASVRDSAVGLRLASKKAGINNWLKKNIGTLEGFERGDILRKSRHREQALSQFLSANPELNAEYGSVLHSLDSLHRASLKTAKRDMIFGRLIWGADYLNMASTIYRWAVEREKENLERDRGYQDRDTLRAIKRLRHAQINLIPSVDRMFFTYFARRALELPSGQKIEAVERLFAGGADGGGSEYIDEVADRMYAGSRIGDLDARLDMFHMSREELEALDDPFMDLATALYPETEEMKERNRRKSGARNRLEPKLLRAYAIWKGRELYPDANGTKRLSYATVAGYSPRDAIRYHHLTGLAGVMEKETGADPFIVPEEVKQVYRDGDFGKYIDSSINDVPVNFLTTNDGTNGNSGSPVINGKGELIGIDFDSNYESVAKDYMYMPRLSRSIVVDIRYALFLMDEVYHLDNLLKELTIR